MNKEIIKMNQLKIKEPKIESLLEDIEIKNREILELKEKLNEQDKLILELRDELHKPCCHAIEAEESIMMRHLTRYLEHEIEYAKAKIAGLRYHLSDYPEDEYSRVDLQNSLLHLNYLHAMMRRLTMY
jgi:ribosomal protein S15P/S13E